MTQKNMQDESLPSNDMFSRNIGLLDNIQQNTLKTSVVAIAGVGGVGGTGAEILARSGICNFKLADPDQFEESNLNRQIGATVDTLTRNKAQVIKERILKINPSATIEIYEQGVNEDNIDDFLKNTDIVVDAIDYYAPKARLLLYRTSRVNIISPPAVGYGTLLMNFKPETFNIEEIFDESQGQFKPESILKGAENLPNAYFNRLSRGTVPTYPPAVFLSGVLIADEVIRTLLATNDHCNPLPGKPPAQMPAALRYDLSERGITEISFDESNS